MKRLLTWLVIGCFVPVFAFAQTTYETFEGGAQLTWTALDGTFGGAIPNPDPTGLNTSATVGSYTKSGAHAFSLFLAELPAPMDLSVNNQFKIKIWSPVATQVLMKLEGTGFGIEATKNIANINVWQEYTFDFSAAAGNTTVTKIILFFDPGVAASADTYLFDDIVADPAGPCAGTVANAEIIDDFECQRNASYGQGWNVLSAVSNPDPSGINTSASVGRYEDPLDQWSALVIDYNAPIDLSTRNYISMKVWAPKTGQILFKLEGGASAPSEVFVPVTQTNQWVEYAVDFSSQAAANHKKIALFFNAGVLATAGDVYYIDDIKRIEKPAPGPLEDFEPMKLTWFPQNNDNTVHGTFNGVIANPDATGANTSANVGSYTKGNSSLSTLVGILNDALDLSQFTQLNLSVWAPTGSQKVKLQLASPTQGVKEVEQTLSATGTWVELNFDFQNFNAITDFDQVNIQFDPGTAAQGTTYYFDNLRQVTSTVDPCAGVAPIPNFLDDFECQRNVNYGAGSNQLTVVNNPDITPANQSLKVGKYADPTDEWSALVLDFGGPIDFSVFNQFTMKIWAPAVVPVLFKLEGGTSPAVEIFTNIKAAGSWQDYSIDFSGANGQNHTRVAIFFNAGVLPSGPTDYFIDDLKWARPAFTGCITTYENAAFSLKGWRYFANGSEETTPFTVVANPDKSGVNTSDSVGVFIEAFDGETFAGMYTDPDAPISLPNNNKTIRMKVWSPRAGDMVMKLERGRNGAPNSGDVITALATANQWTELTWDFSALPNDALYDRITLILGFGVTPATTTTIYFDDIVIADASCATTGIDRERIQTLRAYPNPATDVLMLDGAENLIRAEVYNLFGQLVLTQDLQRTETAEIQLGNLPAGMYIFAGYDRTGLVANARFVKN